MDRAIEQVTQEYEEKQRRMKEKGKKAKKDGDDDEEKGKKKKEDEEEEDDAKAKKERDDKVRVAFTPSVITFSSGLRTGAMVIMLKIPLPDQITQEWRCRFGIRRNSTSTHLQATQVKAGGPVPRSAMADVFEKQHIIQAATRSDANDRNR